MTWVAPRRISPILILIATTGMQAQTDPPKPPPQVETKQLQMAAGAARLDKKIDAKNAKVGEVVTAKLMDEIHCADGVLLPKDATLSGHVVEVQPSENKGDSKLVLTFDQLIVKGKPPLTVKVTLMGLVSPPVSGPDLVSGKVDPENMPAAISTIRQGSGSVGAPGAPRAGSGRGTPTPRGVIWDQPSHEGSGLKDSTVPGVELNSSIRDPNSGTMTSKGKNTQLPLWTQLKIAIIDLPPNAAIK